MANAGAPSLEMIAEVTVLPLTRPFVVNSGARPVKVCSKPTSLLKLAALISSVFRSTLI